MRSGWNPTRRNRNIGTAKRGHGQNNRLEIPLPSSTYREYYERLVQPVEVERHVHGRPVVFLVEPTHRGFVHACSIDDLMRLLELIPAEHMEEINLIVLRQPKRKERIMEPAWGRLAYSAYIGAYSGRAIFLEATSPNVPFRWSKSLSPYQQRELERLREAGHHVVPSRTHYTITPSVESIRATQLYHTLPHEVGHNVDYILHCERPRQEAWDKGDYSDRIDKSYDSKPTADKEAFAHRYADELRARLKALGEIPFARIMDESRMGAEGLDPVWFRDPGGASAGSTDI